MHCTHSTITKVTRERPFWKNSYLRLGFLSQIPKSYSAGGNMLSRFMFQVKIWEDPVINNTQSCCILSWPDFAKETRQVVSPAKRNRWVWPVSSGCSPTRWASSSRCDVSGPCPLPYRRTPRTRWSAGLRWHRTPSPDGDHKLRPGGDMVESQIPANVNSFLEGSHK